MAKSPEEIRAENLILGKTSDPREKFMYTEVEDKNTGEISDGMNSDFRIDKLT